MSDDVGQGKSNKLGWLWPFGVAMTGVAGLGLVLIRGCWHRKMSWPVRDRGYAYQVCLGCGVKRLFDEDLFRAFGPFRYDLNQLIEWDRAHAVRTSPAARSKSVETSASPEVPEQEAAKTKARAAEKFGT